MPQCLNVPLPECIKPSRNAPLVHYNCIVLLRSYELKVRYKCLHSSEWQLLLSFSKEMLKYWFTEQDVLKKSTNFRTPYEQADKMRCPQRNGPGTDEVSKSCWVHFQSLDELLCPLCIHQCPIYCISHKISKR